MKPWSFSALKTFETCPRKYHAEKVEKTVPYQETVHTRYGTEVHTACEEYIRDGKPLPEGMERFQDTLDALVRIEGEKLCELEMALKRDRTPTTFKADDVWTRGIADLIILNEHKAFVVDYKTGSARFPDKDQLELMALMVFAHYPEVQSVKAALVFLVHNVVVKDEYTRDQEADLWDKWEKKAATLEAAFAADHWAPKPNGLCRKWCGVTHCEYQGD